MTGPLKAPALDPDNPHSAVYLAARREWNERYGSYIGQAHAWRLTALASLGVAFVAIVGIAWMGAQSRIVPYVVQTDKLGDAIAVSRADVSPPRQIAAASLGQQFGKLGQEYARWPIYSEHARNSAGLSFRGYVNKDMHLRPYVDHRSAGGTIPVNLSPMVQ